MHSCNFITRAGPVIFSAQSFFDSHHKLHTLRDFSLSKTRPVDHSPQHYTLRMANISYPSSHAHFIHEAIGLCLAFKMAF